MPFIPLQDGQRGHDDYPAEQPVLTKPPRPTPAAEPYSALGDRDTYVLHIRPLLIAGGMIETEAMKDEAKAIRKRLAKTLPPLGKTLPNGDIVPIDWLASGEVPPEEDGPPPMDAEEEIASMERDEGTCPF